MPSAHKDPALRDQPVIPDQQGRHWVITGATNGIGQHVAEAAARAGATLTLTARDPDRGEQTAARLREFGVEVAVVGLDLSDQRSIVAGVETIGEPIDVLVNNAGAVSPKRQWTVDGHELMIATNFLGPFTLTNQLADRIRGRIVVTASNIHRRGRVDGADPHFRHRHFTWGAGYAQSKLCDMLWARALQYRLQASGSAVQVQLAHPGWAMTNIQNVTGVAALDRSVTVLTSRMAQPAVAGAQPIIRAAVDALDPLTYLGPDGPGRLRGRPAPETPSALALDDDAADRVWQLAVRETGHDL